MNSGGSGFLQGQPGCSSVPGLLFQTSPVVPDKLFEHIMRNFKLQFDLVQAALERTLRATEHIVQPPTVQFNLEEAKVGVTNP